MFPLSASNNDGRRKGLELLWSSSNLLPASWKMVRALRGVVTWIEPWTNASETHPFTTLPKWEPRKIIKTTYFSMAETCLVSNFPLVKSSGVIRPSKSRPSFAIFTRISLTSSPMYIPLTIFSNLIKDTQKEFVINSKIYSLIQSTALELVQKISLCVRAKCPHRGSGSREVELLQYHIPVSPDRPPTCPFPASPHPRTPPLCLPPSRHSGPHNH